MDEPLGALDRNLREQMKIEIKRIHRDVGVTVLYVTHDQEEALTMSDRVALMNRGRIAQLGSAEDLYERPATRFVAEFIGESNLIEGRVESSGAALVLAMARGSSAQWPGFGLSRPETCTLMVRPEKIILGPADRAIGRRDSTAGGGGHLRRRVHALPRARGPDGRHQRQGHQHACRVQGQARGLTSGSGGPQPTPTCAGHMLRSGASDVPALSNPPSRNPPPSGGRHDMSKRILSTRRDFVKNGRRARRDGRRLGPLLPRAAGRAPTRASWWS